MLPRSVSFFAITSFVFGCGGGDDEGAATLEPPCAATEMHATYSVDWTFEYSEDGKLTRLEGTIDGLPDYLMEQSWEGANVVSRSISYADGIDRTAQFTYSDGPRTDEAWDYDDDGDTVNDGLMTTEVWSYADGTGYTAMYQADGDHIVHVDYESSGVRYQFSDYAYDDQGRRIEMQQDQDPESGDGVDRIDTWTFNDQGHMTALLVDVSSPTEFGIVDTSYRYTYDDLDRVTELAFDPDGEQAILPTVTVYTYEENRLVREVTTPPTTEQVATDYAFDCDPAGS
jgi:hypothetical protein